MAESRIEVIRSLYDTRFYQIWVNMKTRCYNPKGSNYERYGARGIKVCTDWQTFGGFFDDMYESYLETGEKLTLDRIDNDGGYEKDNCRWSDRIEQANNRRSNRMITYNNKTQSVMQWSRDTGLNRRTITQRLDNGWGVKRSLTEEVHFG